MRALEIDHSHSVSALYAASALTMGEGFMGNLMINSYSLGMKFAQNFKTDLTKAIYSIRFPLFSTSTFVAASLKKKKHL